MICPGKQVGILYEPVAVRHRIIVCTADGGMVTNRKKTENACLTGSHKPGKVIGGYPRRPDCMRVKSKHPDRSEHRFL